MRITADETPRAIAQELGHRIKQARLNKNLTQAEVAEKSGLERRAVLNAEKGKSTLEDFVMIMDAIGLIGHLDSFLPPQPISPLQLLKLRGKVRQRASGHNKLTHKAMPSNVEEDLGW